MTPLAWRRRLREADLVIIIVIEQCCTNSTKTSFRCHCCVVIVHMYIKIIFTFGRTEEGRVSYITNNQKSTDQPTTTFNICNKNFISSVWYCTSIVC